jgi:hypothetical protein
VGVEAIFGGFLPEIGIEKGPSEDCGGQKYWSL